MQGFIVTGTDTDIGKTVVAAMLTVALQGVYFKPIQSGTVAETDVQAVRRMTGLLEDRVLPSAVMLSQPLSPHRAAELDGMEIDLHGLVLPRVPRPLIVEGAGGLLVPVTRDVLQAELFKSWDLPLILCARTGLGTINHTLLSIEAIRARKMAVWGVIFVGDDNADNIRTIAEMGAVKVLGRLPMLEMINADTLANIFEQHFNREDFGA
ncbi:MAG: dethiobiotin synthase [Rhodospirillales bacterium]|nr:dethiobiotin synthase [Rhodospirillales bacterium]